MYEKTIKFLQTVQPWTHPDLCIDITHALTLLEHMGKRQSKNLISDQIDETLKEGGTL